MGNIILNIAGIPPSTKKYTYKDIKVPLDETFSANYDIVAIKASLKNIFNFRLGQRILDPKFGNILYLYLYEPINDITLNNIEQDILNMLKYEPRINVVSIKVTPLMDDSQLDIEVQYIIPTLNYINVYKTSLNMQQK